MEEKVDESPKTKRERFEKLLLKPDLLEIICTHISNGGTVITLAEIWEVRFGDITNWLHSDKERSERYVKALGDRAEFAVERVLQELRRIGLADPRKIYDDHGNVKPIKEWDAETASTVASIEAFEKFEGVGADREFTGVIKKVKFNDKIKALELLGKNLSLFIDQVKHSGSVKLEDLLVD